MASNRRLQPYTKRIGARGRLTENPHPGFNKEICPGCGDPFPPLSENSRIYGVKDGSGKRLFGARSCYCGTEARCDEWTGSVECFLCKDCGSECSSFISTSKCSECELKIIGIKDPLMWRAALEESVPYMTPSKQDMIDSILWGLLNNKPGLTIKNEDI